MFPIPEIIYDPTLILSPHTFFLGIIFKIQTFKSSRITSPEKLYSLRVLDGLDEQKLPFRDELMDGFVFCKCVKTPQGMKIDPTQKLSSDWFRYNMKLGGEITGFGDVMKPKNHRYGLANGLNSSGE